MDTWVSRSRRKKNGQHKRAQAWALILEMLEQPKIIIIKLIYFQNESTDSLFQKKTLQTTYTISIMQNPLGFPNYLSNLTKKALKGKQAPEMKILYFLWSPAT